jgi:hypothetical protein
MIPVCGAGVHTDVYNLDAAIPTGMQVKVFGIIASCLSSNAGTVIVGATADTNGYLEAKTLVTESTLYFPFDGVLGSSITVTDADDLLVTLGGTGIVGGRVDLVGYVTAHSSDLSREGV